MMNPPGFSPSSFFSEDIFFSDERQVARKMESITDYSSLKLDGALRMEGTTSSPHQSRIQLDLKMGKGLVAPPDCYVFHGRNVNLPFGKHVVGAERVASRSLPSAIDQDLGSQTNSNAEPAPYLFDGDKRNLMGSQYENGLFSSSLSDLFSRNLKLSSNRAAYSHSVAAAADVASHYQEEEAFESTEELEAQTIGNLLPDDDDLLSGVTDGFDTIFRHNNGDEMEELDLFSSVGGLELGEDGFSQRHLDLSDLNFNNQLAILSAIGSEHPLGEHPSRTLFVRNINSSVEDSKLNTLFGHYGDIRTLYTACKHRGFVMISYYDIRAACNAMKSLQNKPLRRRKLDIYFSIPKENPSGKDINQGTLSVFNLDSSVSNDELREILGVYGEVREIRDTPGGSHHKYVEFYDVRAAESALRALNRSDIGGKQIMLEPGRPGGSKRFIQPFLSELEHEEFGVQLQQHSTSNNLATGFSGSLSLGAAGPRTDNGIILGSHSMNEGSIGSLVDHVFHSGVSSSVSNSLPSLLRVEPGNQSTITNSGHLRNHLKFELHGTSNLHVHSLPDYHDALSNGLPFGSPGNIAANFSSRPPEIIDGQQLHRVGTNGKSLELNEVFGSYANGSCPPPGRHFMWNNSCHPQSPALWPSSPSFVNGIGPAHPQHLRAVPRAPSHILNSVLPLNNHHVGSAPSANPSLWDWHHAYAGESPDATVFHPGSLGNMRISGNSPHPLEFVPHNIFHPSGVTSLDMPIPSKNVGLHPHHQRCMILSGRGQMLPMMGSFDAPNERSRNRRNEGNLSQADNKKQFELDLDRILRGDDRRTTLMIKNIPNNYESNIHRDDIVCINCGLMEQLEVSFCHSCMSKRRPHLIGLTSSWYTSKMLLAAIDEQHKGTYDFIYLPIDFKNKCNVGYAFINMTDPSLIVPFYQTFNGKKWEKFNSEKVASLAYARIQGKVALIAHFQNSSLMNEDKRCRPILFHTDGPNAGDQVPFPMGANIRARPGKLQSNFFEENTQESSLSSVACEDFSNGDSSSGSGKDSD